MKIVDIGKWVYLLAPTIIIADFSLMIPESQVKILEYSTNRRININLATNISQRKIFSNFMEGFKDLNASHILRNPNVDKLERTKIAYHIDNFIKTIEKIDRNFDLINSLKGNESTNIIGECGADTWTVQDPILNLATTTFAATKLALYSVKNNEGIPRLEESCEDLKDQLGTILRNTSDFFNLAYALKSNSKNIDTIAYLKKQNLPCLHSNSDFFISFSKCNSGQNKLACLINIQFYKQAGIAKKFLPIPHQNRSICYKNLLLINNSFATTPCLPAGLSCPIITIEKEEQDCLLNLHKNKSSSLAGCKICDNKFAINQTPIGTLIQNSAVFKVNQNFTHDNSSSNFFNFKTAAGELFQINSSYVQLKNSTLIRSKLPFAIIINGVSIDYAPNSDKNILIEIPITNNQLQQLLDTGSMNDIELLLSDWQEYTIPSIIIMIFLIICFVFRWLLRKGQEKRRIRTIRNKQRKYRDDEPEKPSPNLMAYLNQDNRRKNRSKTSY